MKKTFLSIILSAYSVFAFAHTPVQGYQNQTLVTPVTEVVNVEPTSNVYFGTHQANFTSDMPEYNQQEQVLSNTDKDVGYSNNTATNTLESVQQNVNSPVNETNTKVAIVSSQQNVGVQATNMQNQSVVVSKKRSLGEPRPYKPLQQTYKEPERPNIIYINNHYQYRR